MEDVWVRILTIFATGVTGLAVFLMVNIFKQHSGLFEDVETIKAEHSRFQLSVSENYAKKTDLNAARLETNQSLERIHARLDNILEIVKK